MESTDRVTNSTSSLTSSSSSLNSSSKSKIKWPNPSPPEGGNLKNKKIKRVDGGDKARKTAEKAGLSSSKELDKLEKNLGKIQTEIDGLYRERDQWILDFYGKVYSEIYQRGQESLTELKETIQQKEKEMQAWFNQKHQELFSRFEKELASITALWDDCMQNAEETKEGELQKLIDGVNFRTLELSSTGNPQHVLSSEIRLFQAVVLKKLELKLSSDPKRQKQRLKAPSFKEMQALKAAFEKKLQATPEKLQAPSTAVELKKLENDLAWGRDFLNHALAQPSNWTVIRKAVVKKSSSKRQHVSVTLIEPLGVEEGGVPSGLRAHPDYKKRPPNFFKTTNYLLGPDSKRLFERSSFRGGAFETKEAAQAALKVILEDKSLASSEKALHINSLLTPTVLIFVKKDKHILKRHKKAVEEALKELKIKGASAFVSNFGVNEAAVGQSHLKLFGKKLRLPLRLGWHESIRGYGNHAAKETAALAKKRLAALKKKLKKGEKLSQEELALFGNLGSLAEAGQQLDALWSQNAFAYAKQSGNPFKTAAFWKVFDQMLGVLCYSNCMSGKDRTGQVESHAHALSDEFYMERIDDSRRMEQLLFERKNLTQSQKELIRTLPYETAKALPKKKKLDQALKKELLARLQNASLALGLKEKQPLFLKEKRVGGRLGTRGIEKSASLKEDEKRRKATEALSLKRGESDGEEANRRAKNIELSLASGAIEVTIMNTSKPGLKVSGGRPLAILSCGFSPQFVLDKLQGSKASSLFVQLTGLDRAPEEEKKRWRKQLDEISEIEDAKERAAAMKKLLLAVVEYKASQLKPQSKVSS